MTMLVQVMDKTLSKLATFDEGSMMGSMLGFVVSSRRGTLNSQYLAWPDCGWANVFQVTLTRTLSLHSTLAHNTLLLLENKDYKTKLM